MTTGVHIGTEKDGVAPGKVVHMSTPEWYISSSVKLKDIFFCPLTTNILPGSLGTYIYPEDAVFCMKNKNTTRCADFKTILKKETVAIFTPETNLSHMTLNSSMLNMSKSDDEEDNDEEEEEHEEEEHDEEEEERDEEEVADCEMDEPTDELYEELV